MLITRNKETGIKRCISKGYNYQFDPKTGEFARWGMTLDDDPKVGMLEIFDLEVSTICEGIPRPGEDVAVPCTHCYKSNTRSGENMSFETFKKIFDLISGGISRINIELEDGTIRSYLPDDTVLLSDGTSKAAKLLTDRDDLAI